jgi:hypothetical protein
MTNLTGSDNRLFNCQFTTGHFQYQLCTANRISGPAGSHILCAVSKVFANLLKCLISLPEKPESFQSLLLDHCLVYSEGLVNSLHVIVPAALPVSVALVSCNFLVLLLLAILWHVAMPDASSITLVHCCIRMQDWFLPDLVQFG